MSDTISTDDSAANVPENIGRNDPCPCGSGKKYKKCCYRTHQVQKEAAKTNRSVENLIGPGTSPWDFYKILAQTHASNLVNLFWELGHELGPFRETYPSKEAFIRAISAGDEGLVAGPEYDLRWIRHDGPDVYLLLTRGLRDPKRDALDFDVVHLRPNELGAERDTRAATHRGWRIWEVHRHERGKGEVGDDHDLGLRDLGYEWAAEWKAS